MTSFSGLIKPLNEYLGWLDSLPDTLAFSCDSGFLLPEEVRASKQYILNFYRDVQSQHTFISNNGAIYDSIPFEMQASVRHLQDKSIPVAPDLPGASDKAEIKQSTQITGNFVRDELGNQKTSSSGLVSIKRITIEEISRFGSLYNFLNNSSFSPPPSGGYDNDAYTHRYGTANASGNNYGCSGIFSVHKNEIDSLNNQMFSLVQLWALTRKGNPVSIQSVEAIILCYPFKYGIEPVVSVFATNDHYRTFNWNNETAVFVQTNPRWILGEAITPISSVDGDQYYLQMATQKVADKWWVYLGGETSEHALGYYPTSFYSQTQSDGLAVAATEIQFGGEATTLTSPNMSFPSMGSGQLNNTGWKKSAYVRDIKTYNTSGGIVIPSFTSFNASPNYGVSRNRYAAPWNETLWYGGPGGT